MPRVTKDKEEIIDIEKTTLAKSKHSKNTINKITSSAKNKKTDNSRVAYRCDPYKCEKKYIKI